MGYLNDKRTQELIDETKKRLAAKEQKVWKGTKEEYEALTEPLPEGTLVVITDDYEEGGSDATLFITDKAGWAALSDEEKAKHDVVCIDDDFADGGAVVVDEVTEGNLNAVTSNAVYGATKKLMLSAVSQEDGFSISGTAEDMFTVKNLGWDSGYKSITTAINVKSGYRSDFKGYWALAINNGDMHLTPLLPIYIYGGTADLGEYQFQNVSSANQFTSVDYTVSEDNIMLNFYRPTEPNMGLDFQLIKIG